MTTFVQFHVLTTYPISNPNRDDMGRPKQITLGGAPRLRLSSQSLKRAYRESEFFEQGLQGHLGTRTKRLAEELAQELIAGGADETKARGIAVKIGGVFSSMEAGKKGEAPPLKATTLAFISPQEWDLAREMAQKELAGEDLKDLKNQILRTADGAVDIAMFGRMLASDPSFNRDAAVQVAHAFTTHRAQAEEDWFAAVDDLNKREDTGAGHLGEHGMGSGVYYLYVCLDADLLIENLNGDKALAARGGEAMVHALAKATPKGMQNSYAHHPRANYMRAERGAGQPRDLSGAFFQPVAADFETDSIRKLEALAEGIDNAFGPSVDADCVMNVKTGQGRLDDIVQFTSQAIRDA